MRVKSCARPLDIEHARQAVWALPGGLRFARRSGPRHRWRGDKQHVPVLGESIVLEDEQRGGDLRLTEPAARELLDQLVEHE